MEEMIKGEGLGEVIDTVKDLIEQADQKIREATRIIEAAGGHS